MSPCFSATKSENKLCGKANAFIDAKRADKPDVIIVNGAPGFEEEVLAGIATVIEGVPIIGGSAAGDLATQGWWVASAHRRRVDVSNSGVSVVMLWTTVPSILVALIVFTMAGLGAEGPADLGKAAELQSVLAHHFNLHWALFLVPVGVIVLIARKVAPVPALFLGVLGGAVAAAIAQPCLLYTSDAADEV